LKFRFNCNSISNSDSTYDLAGVLCFIDIFSPSQTIVVTI
jgi:hypothetical protein